MTVSFSAVGRRLLRLSFVLLIFVFILHFRILTCIVAVATRRIIKGYTPELQELYAHLV